MSNFFDFPFWLKVGRNPEKERKKSTNTRLQIVDGLNVHSFDHESCDASIACADSSLVSDIALDQTLHHNNNTVIIIINIVISNIKLLHHAVYKHITRSRAQAQAQEGASHQEFMRGRNRAEGFEHS